jgi:hypothetical protein
MHSLLFFAPPWFFMFIYCNDNQTTGVTIRQSRITFPLCRGLGIFLFTTASRTALGLTQHFIQWVPGTLSLEVKRSGREADHSPPSTAEVREWVELYLHSPYAFMTWGSVKKHRDNFTCCSFYRLGPLTFVDSELPWIHLDISVGLLEEGIGPSQVLNLHRTWQHSKMRTYIRASIKILTHDPGVRVF